MFKQEYMIIKKYKKNMEVSKKENYSQIQTKITRYNVVHKLQRFNILKKNTVYTNRDLYTYHLCVMLHMNLQTTYFLLNGLFINL